MHCLKEPLQTIEAFFALDSDQVIFTCLSRSIPAARNEGSVVRDIFLVDESKTRLLYQLLIDSRRHEKKQTNGAPEG